MVWMIGQQGKFVRARIVGERRRRRPANRLAVEVERAASSRVSDPARSDQPGLQLDPASRARSAIAVSIEFATCVAPFKVNQLSPLCPASESSDGNRAASGHSRAPA